MEDEFLEQTNATPKKLGHNKLQLDIESLNKEIEKWRLCDAEKEMKLVMFKKTIAQLQSQAKDQRDKMNQLEETSKNTQLLQAAEDLKVSNNTLTSERDSLLETVAKVKDEIAQQNSVVQTLQSTNQTLTNQVSRLNDDYLKIKQAFDGQTDALAQATERSNELAKEVIMHMSICDSLKTELESVKTEIQIYKDYHENQKTTRDVQTTTVEETKPIINGYPRHKKRFYE
jgi:chromosome segregation ATPase